MGLTRIRAEQISDIDYKQAVRVISTANVTLTGGAPSQVDGVNLNANDRILVTGQGTASQNGLYDVTVVGTGSDGTWVRTSDANTTGEINAGMIVMITEGNTYADTSWKLITDDPINIGVTALIFLQNTGNSFNIINVVGSANVAANGVSSTVAFASGNNFSITGNATTDTITFDVSQSPSFTGNVTGNYIIGDGSLLTNINAGNITGSYGNANVANYLPTFSGNLTAGNVSVTGNVTGGNLITVGLLSATGNATAGNILTAGLISATGNITGGNISVVGNVNGNNIVINSTLNFSNNGNVAVYQTYNSATGSLDTIFN
jgi:hypothetical protein